MGFKFASFGAATMPLSKIVVDKNLDLRPYGVTAAFCKAPMTPDVWPTETLDWGDIPPGEPIPFEGSISPKDTWITLFTFDVPTGDSYKWRFTFIIQVGSSDTKGTLKITANGEEIFYVSDVSTTSGTITRTFDVIIPAGSTVTIQWSKTTDLLFKVLSGSNVQNLGIVGAKTFDLTDKWLALGIDMKGVDATIKIQGVEIPYEEYIKYFPIAPTELKIIPVDWGQTQERPVIKVYKETLDWLEETWWWKTETLDWGDTAPQTLDQSTRIWSHLDLFKDVIMNTPFSGYYTVTIDKVPDEVYITSGKIRYKEKIVEEFDALPWTSRPLFLNAGDELYLQDVTLSGDAKGKYKNMVVFTGKVGGAKTFDLTDKWLALGIDMKGLDAMIEIQGELVPYEKYIYYFPVKPTKLIIPGNWEPTQERPEIKVYKND